MESAASPSDNMFNLTPGINFVSLFSSHYIASEMIISCFLDKHVMVFSPDLIQCFQGYLLKAVACCQS